MATIEDQRDIVAAFREGFRSRPNLPVVQTQKAFPNSAPVKGPVWIAQDDLRVAGEDNVRDCVFGAVQSAATEPIILPLQQEVHARDVHVEWIGQRPGAARDAKPPPGLSDAQIYEKLQSDVQHDFTIMFAHGGAFYLGSSATSRATTTKLARLTKARVLSVDYRLAPQDQFPAQLLDLFLVYLALLYPAAGSKHSPVSPSKIVLSGESSGGGLCLSLIQLILQLQRKQKSSKPIVRFGGRDVIIHMPAGVTVLSAEADRSLGLRSWTEDIGNIDYLPDVQPANAPTNPPDEVWPSKPPRHDVYCHSSAFLNPIANPCVASSWEGSPPLWFAYGEERCVDAGKLVASTAAKQDVFVRFTEYKGMPHIFAIVLPHFQQSQACVAEWAVACRDLAEGKKSKSHARCISSEKQPGDSSTDQDLKFLLGYSREQALEMIRAATNKRAVYVGKSKARSVL